MDRFACNEAAMGPQAVRALSQVGVNVIGAGIGAEQSLFSLIGLGVGEIAWFAGRQTRLEERVAYLRKLNPRLRLQAYGGPLSSAFAVEGPVINAEPEWAVSSAAYARRNGQFLYELTGDIASPLLTVDLCRSAQDSRAKLAAYVPRIHDSRSGPALELGAVIAANRIRRATFSIAEQEKRLDAGNGSSYPLKQPVSLNWQRIGKVLVVGTGGIGTFAILSLARAGTKEIDLVDYDTVAEENLNRQIMYGDAIGQKKCCAAAQYLERWHSVATRAYDEKVSDEGIWRERIRRRNYDAIFCCVDNVAARKVLSALAYRLRRRLIEGGCDDRCGVVSDYQGTGHSLTCKRRLQPVSDPPARNSCGQAVNPSVIIPNAAVGTLMAYAATMPQNDLLYFSSINRKVVWAERPANNPCYCEAR